MPALQHVATAVPKAQPEDAVKAALRQALSIAEEEASDNYDSVIDISEQQQGPTQHTHGPGADTRDPSGDMCSAGLVLDMADRSTPADGRSHLAGSPKKEVPESKAAAQPVSLSSKSAADDAAALPASASAAVQQKTQPASIAYTGPVQDMSGSMPGIPGASTSSRHAAAQKQQQLGSMRAAKSDAELAAELAADAEEEMRADLERQEQQEPPGEDEPAGDPWAEDPWYGVF